MWAALTSAVSFVAAWLKTSEALQTYVGKPIKWLGWVGVALAVVVTGVTLAPIVKHWRQPVPTYVTEAQFDAYRKESATFMRVMVVKAVEIGKAIEQCQTQPATKRNAKQASLLPKAK